MRLYEIAQQYQSLAELLENPEFSENTDILTALEKIEDDFEHKVAQIVFIIRNLKAEINPLDEEIKRLQAIKKARENNIDRLRESLIENLKKTGISRVKSPFFSLSYSEKENSAVQLDKVMFLSNNLDESLVTVTIEPNKKAIKQALKEGRKIKGAELIDSEVLTIR